MAAPQKKDVLFTDLLKEYPNRTSFDQGEVLKVNGEKVKVEFPYALKVVTKNSQSVWCLLDPNVFKEGGSATLFRLAVINNLQYYILNDEALRCSHVRKITLGSSAIACHYPDKECLDWRKDNVPVPDPVKVSKTLPNGNKVTGMEVILPYFDAPDLLDLSNNEDLNLVEIMDINLATAQNVKIFHMSGRVHNDLKPENFLLFQNGDDNKWLSILIDREFVNASRKCGTPLYMAPEPVNSTASDIFSLGVTYASLLKIYRWSYCLENHDDMKKVWDCYYLQLKKLAEKYNSSANPDDIGDAIFKIKGKCYEFFLAQSKNDSNEKARVKKEFEQLKSSLIDYLPKGNKAHVSANDVNEWIKLVTRLCQIIMDIVKLEVAPIVDKKQYTGFISENTQRLHGGSEEKKAALNSMFDLIGRMTNIDPGKRPSIGDVISSLLRIESNYCFSSASLQEELKQVGEDCKRLNNESDRKDEEDDDQQFSRQEFDESRDERVVNNNSSSSEKETKDGGDVELKSGGPLERSIEKDVEEDVKRNIDGFLSAHQRALQPISHAAKKDRRTEERVSCRNQPNLSNTNNATSVIVTASSLARSL